MGVDFTQLSATRKYNMRTLMGRWRTKNWDLCILVDGLQRLTEPNREAQMHRDLSTGNNSRALDVVLAAGTRHPKFSLSSEDAAALLTLIAEVRAAVPASSSDAAVSRVLGRVATIILEDGAVPLNHIGALWPETYQVIRKVAPDRLQVELF